MGSVSNDVTKLQTALFSALEDNKRAMKFITLAHAKSRKDMESLRHDTNAFLERLERGFAESHILAPPPPLYAPFTQDMIIM